jgi:hypothetical protein
MRIFLKIGLRDIFGIVKLRALVEVFQIIGCKICSKGRSKIAKFCRNPGGLLVYIKHDISKMVKEIE